MFESASFLYILDFLLVVLIIFYYDFTRGFSHWKNLDVPYLHPKFPFGNAFEVFAFKKSFGEFISDIYRQGTEPYEGFFIFNKPRLLVRDPDLIRGVLVKDFDHFGDHSVCSNMKHDPIGSNIPFCLKIENGWKETRRKINPIFSSVRIKSTLQCLQKIGGEMNLYLREEVMKDCVVDVKNLSTQYTTEVFTLTAFGFSDNCFWNNKSHFLQASRRVFNGKSWERVVSTTSYFLSEKLVKCFKLNFIDKDTCNFLKDVLWTTMEQRQESQSNRNDLVDLLLQWKKSDNINSRSSVESDMLVAPLAGIFVGAGETSTITMSFILYELALNPKIQTELRKEVLTAIQNYGCLDYDAITKMDYLDMCVHETLRKYPPVPFLNRQVTADYKIAGTDVVLKKGSVVFVSVLGMHLDPQYYPNPDIFDPMRFSEKSVESRPNFTYLPFGDGPRSCTGARQALLSIKSGVAHIVSEFEVQICQETRHPIEFITNGLLMGPKSHLFLKFQTL